MTSGIPVGMPGLILQIMMLYKYLNIRFKKGFKKTASKCTFALLYDILIYIWAIALFFQFLLHQLFEVMRGICAFFYGSFSELFPNRFIACKSYFLANHTHNHMYVRIYNTFITRIYIYTY